MLCVCSSPVFAARQRFLQAKTVDLFQHRVLESADRLDDRDDEDSVDVDWRRGSLGFRAYAMLPSCPADGDFERSL